QSAGGVRQVGPTMSVHEQLRCPTCRAGLRPDGSGVLERSRSGILACHCADHPVVEGIVCINVKGARWPEGARVLARLKEGRADLAAAEALLGSCRLMARRIVSRLEREIGRAHV